MGSFFATPSYQQAKVNYEAAKQQQREFMLKTGQITFSMSPDKDAGFWNFAKGILWVGKGHVDELWGYIFEPDQAVIRFSSTPEEDIAMLDNIRGQMSRNHTQYGAVVWSCVHWSFAQRSTARELVERQVIEGLP